MIIDDSYKLTEEDVKNRYITPAIDRAGWKKEQCRMEFYFTDGQIIIDDLGPARSKERGKIDYLLNSKGGLPLAVVEAKEESLEPSYGLQQAKIIVKQSMHPSLTAATVMSLSNMISSLELRE
ncbi:MAG: hypothetical protein E7Z62_05285 [Thermoplasmata archaeon]|nr:hypothetical protein [Thermoplasmata archaeon]